MRPLKLTIKGFTAFREEQELDFRALDLFALWGPTGSGKSSVLDAITYALYGKAERVEGAREVGMSELISHGQKRMAVSFEFAIGDQHLRVTRSTPRSGSSSARLEKNEGGEWRTYGEGADRVRDVTRKLEELIGLDYDAFTRSVILPQGKFAEFLNGDAAQRRKILIELLGLELFVKMAAHANQIGREARLRVETTEGILAEQFAHVSTDVVDAAQLAVREAQERARDSATIQKAVSDLTGRAAEIERSLLQIDRCSTKSRELVDTFTSHRGALQRLTRSLQTVGEQIDEATIDLEKAADAVEGAEADLAKAQDELGTNDALISLRNRLDLLDAGRSDVASAIAAVEDAEASVGRAAEGLEAAELRGKNAAKAAAEAHRLLVREQEHLDSARRRDLIATIARGLNVGDPCPVCGGPIGSLPEVETHALEAAEGDLATAKQRALDADGAAAEADKAVALARQTLEAAGNEVARAGDELQRRAAGLASLEEEIGKAFGGEVPDDARAQIDRRLIDLKELAAAVAEALGQRAEAEKTLLELGRLRDKDLAEVAAIRAAMGATRVDSLVEDAVAALPGLRRGISDRPLPEDAADLERVAGAMVDALEVLGAELSAGRADQNEELASIAAEARALLPAEECPDGDDIGAINDVAAELHTRRRDELVRLETEAEKLSELLETKRALEDQVVRRRAERDLYADLARELRTDRIVDYLQAEALAMLAETGSVHLERLSDHRYRLSYEEDRFFVVDAWNGEERRSVRTLSGGETFLASLALALALAEGVQMLAVTQKSRLESLFLDEGFGTLDAETLKAVVDALDRLGSEDRLVGVITHITALADELPVRVEVAKSPRGSTIRTTVTEAPTAYEAI